MLVHLLLLIFILFLLFLIARKISSYIYLFLYLLTTSQTFSVSILSLILLPGTIIHELSHFFFASVLRVPTGELSVIPTIDEKTGQVKAGKLEIGKVDPFRHTIVGLAPTIIGIVLIFVIGKIFFQNFQLTTYNLQLITLLGFYLLFVISATMFSSNKDMESLKIALPVTCLIILSLYFIGLRLSLTSTLIIKIESLLKELNGYLLISTLINFLVFLILVINLKLWQKILKRQILQFKQ